MKRAARVFLACLGAAFGCAGARGGSSPAPAAPAVAFTVSSIPSAYGIQGRFAGSATISDGWIDLVIASGAVRMQQRDPRLYNALRVRASVARCTTRGQWETAAEGSVARIAPALGVDPSVGPADVTEHKLADSIRLSVAVPRDTDPARAWVALILEWPFENDFASYSLHTAVPIVALTQRPGAPRWDGSRDAPDAGRCR